MWRRPRSARRASSVAGTILFRSARWQPAIPAACAARSWAGSGWRHTTRRSPGKCALVSSRRLRSSNSEGWKRGKARISGGRGAALTSHDRGQFAPNTRLPGDFESGNCAQGWQRVAGPHRPVRLASPAMSYVEFPTGAAYERGPPTSHYRELNISRRDRLPALRTGGGPPVLHVVAKRYPARQHGAEQQLAVHPVGWCVRRRPDGNGGDARSAAAPRPHRAISGESYRLRDKRTAGQAARRTTPAA